MGILGLRARSVDVAVTRWALAAAAVAMTLFALAHFYALVDEDVAILLFSVFMVLTSIGMIVAGVAILRSTSGRVGHAAPLLRGLADPHHPGRRSPRRRAALPRHRRLGRVLDGARGEPARRLDAVGSRGTAGRVVASGGPCR